jgi:putative oxidoreductase
MSAAIRFLTDQHAAIFRRLETALDGWFLGLAARFAFAAVLYFYFLSSAKTKIGDGPFGFLSITDNAYYQIALPAVEAANFDIPSVPFHWDLIVALGTYGEFVLPVLLMIGLFSRIAALGMIIFILVQSYVDIAVHAVDAQTIGAWFDRFPDGVIADQRLLWVFPLAYVAIKSAGAVSLLSRRRARMTVAAPHPA